MRLLLLLFLLLNSFFVHAQNMITDTTAEVVTYWLKGDVRKLEKTTTREKYVNDALVFKTISVADIEVKVLDEIDTNYVVEWKFKETRVNESEEEIVKRFAEMSKDLKTTFRIKDTGIYEALVNYEEMREFFTNEILLMRERTNNDTLTKQIHGIMQQLFETRETVEAGFSKDIKLYHFPYGAEYKIDETIIENITIPNPFTGDPVDASLLFKMTKLDFPSMSCTIEGTLNITEEDSKLYIKDFIKQLQAKGVENIPAESDIPTMQVSDQYTHVIELLNGWVTHVEHKRTVNSGIVKQIDVTIIKMVEP